MNFEIKELKQEGNNLIVRIEKDDGEFEAFGLPIGMAENNEYVSEIKKILKERAKQKIVKIDTSIIGKKIIVK